MTAESSRSFRLRTVVLVVLAAAYVGWAARFIARSAVETNGGRYFCLFDDAMVSLRYAWNLAHGDGLVWNPGERVEGITSLLFTLTMAAGALFLGKSAAALFVQLTAIPLVLGVALLAHRLQRRLDAALVPGLLTAAAVLVYYPLSYWSLMGMETGFLTALAMGALLVAMRLGQEPRGSKLLGLLLGLMFATRPDAAIPAVAILVFRAGWILRGRPRLGALGPWLVEVAVFAGVVLGLTLFRLLYFGAPLPNTYQLKMANWPLYFRLRNGWKYVMPFLESSRYLILLALGSVALRRDGRRLLLLGFAGSVVACQVWVGGDAWAYWRMLAPGVVALIVLAVDGARGLARWAMGWVQGIRPRLLGPLLVAILGTAGLAKALWDADAPFMNELRMKIPAYTVAVNHDRVEDGIALSRYVAPEGSVAVFAAGIVPYYSGLRGVDAFGKSDPFIARLPGLGFDDGRTVTPGHNKFDLHYSIETLRPDAIYDALAWARYDGPEILEFVQRHYVQRGSFWLRRDSPHVHWDRVPPR
jgi:arabinofuranosyltransferase